MVVRGGPSSVMEAYVCSFAASETETDAGTFPIGIGVEQFQLEFLWRRAFCYAGVPDVFGAEIQFVLFADLGSARRCLCPPRVKSLRSADGVEYSIRRNLDDEVVKNIWHRDLDNFMRALRSIQLEIAPIFRRHFGNIERDFQRQVAGFGSEFDRFF